MGWNPFGRREKRPRGTANHQADELEDWLVHTANPYMLPGVIEADPNLPISHTPLQVRYPTGIASKATKMMGMSYDGTASHLNPNMPMVEDTIDPIWFPELGVTVQPTTMPAINESDIGSEF